MLIHITPKIIADPQYQCDLIDIQIKEFNLILRNGVDVKAMRPYPNKGYLVGCSKASRKATIGILVDIADVPDKFTVVTRWAFNASVLTHQTNYVVLDKEYSVVSDNMLLWYAMNGVWESRWPDVHSESIPAFAAPRMDIWKSGDSSKGRQGDVIDTHDGNMIVKRVETFCAPSIEPGRLFENKGAILFDRLPKLEMAFKSVCSVPRESI